MSSRASPKERTEFVRRMQQLYPGFNVTEPCYYIMSKAATWVRCQETIEWREAGGFKDRPLANTQRRLAKQRIERRAAEDFPRHCIVVFDPDQFEAMIWLGFDSPGLDSRYIPVPTSKRRQTNE